MINKTLILIAKKNNTWIDIVKTFGLAQPEAEDVVQEMYIKIQIKLEGGTNIMYGEEINYYYIYKTLKHITFDYLRKQEKMPTISIDDADNLVEYYNKDKFIAPKSVNYDEAYKIVLSKLNRMYWYDRKVFEVIHQGESIADFSRKSKIHYYSLARTYNKVKKELKKLL